MVSFWLPRYRRAGPSTSLDKSAAWGYSIGYAAIIALKKENANENTKNAGFGYFTTTKSNRMPINGLS